MVRPRDPLDAAPGTSAADRRTVESRLDLAPFGLHPGSQIALWATAADYHDQVAKSETRRLTVLAPDELRERLAARQSRLAAELERLLHLERTCRQQVAAIERRLGNGEDGAADLGDLEAAERGQLAVNESLTSRADGVPAPAGVVGRDGRQPSRGGRPFVAVGGRGRRDRPVGPRGPAVAGRRNCWPR